MAQVSLHIRVRVFNEQHGGFVVEGRKKKNGRESGIYMRGSSLPSISHKRYIDEKQEEIIIHIFEAAISKEYGDLEKREKWKERNYRPGGRRHCNAAGKAAWLPVTSSCPCPAHMPQCTCPGHPALCGSDRSPLLYTPPRG